MTYAMAAFLYCVLALSVLVCGVACLAAGAWEVGSGLLVLSFLLFLAVRHFDKGSRS